MNSHGIDQMALAEAYRHGRGVPKDVTKAAHWFGRAAETGHPQAQGANSTFAKGHVPLLTLLSSACHLSVQFTMRFAWRRTALSSCVACDGKDEVAAGRCRWKRKHIIIRHAALQRAQRARRFRRVTGRHYHRLIPADVALGYHQA